MRAQYRPKLRLFLLILALFLLWLQHKEVEPMVISAVPPLLGLAGYLYWAELKGRNSLRERFGVAVGLSLLWNLLFSAIRGAGWVMMGFFYLVPLLTVFVLLEGSIFWLLSWVLWPGKEREEEQSAVEEGQVTPQRRTAGDGESSFELHTPPGAPGE